LSVLRPNGSHIPLISSSDTGSSPAYRKGTRQGQVQEYADYILQSITEQRVEKQQIIETFGDSFVYFFGERPRMIEIRGLLINTEDFNWHSQFWKNYEEHLRGTKLVQANARVYLSFDTIIIEGYILQAQASMASEAPYSVPFGFSMLATARYDWSDIGQTRFPGYAENLASLDVLNFDLQQRRSRFVSTGAQVRLRNLLAPGSTGIASTIRRGIGAWNGGVAAAANYLQKGANIIGGRNVRVPVGIAGYLQSVGSANVAGGSIGTGSVGVVGTEQVLQSEFDRATGRLGRLNEGSVKLRMPATAGFGQSWTSMITGGPRGYIKENVDEYPTYGDPKTLKDLVSFGQHIELEDRRLTRLMAVGRNDFELAMHNQLAQMGNVVGDLAEAVNFVKGNFGMVMSVVSLARDFPDGTIKGLRASLGIGQTIAITTTGASSTRIEEARSDPYLPASSPQNRRKEIEIARRNRSATVRSFAEKAKEAREAEYIGAKAAELFGATATRVSNNPQEPVSLGEAYKSNTYTPNAEMDAESADYEAAYGDNEYSSLSRDPELAVTLDEVYGNTSDETELDVDPASLEEVYGTGSSSSSVITGDKVVEILERVKAGDIEPDETTSSIRGVGDDDSEIQAVV
jgi:hypothetical protein